MSAEIRLRVLHIIAGAADLNPEDLRVYFRLRKKKGDIPGLNLDSAFIQGLTPIFQAWLTPFKERMTPGEVDDPKNVLTISDLADLIEKKIDRAKSKRLAKIVDPVFSWLQQTTGLQREDMTQELLLKQPPLSLNSAAISELRDVLNQHLVQFGLQMPVTTAEMSDLKTIGNVIAQIKTELKASDVF